MYPLDDPLLFIFMKDYFSRINPTVKGITLAFMATLGMANVYVFSKAAFLEVSYFNSSFTGLVLP